MVTISSPQQDDHKASGVSALTMDSDDGQTTTTTTNSRWDDPSRPMRGAVRMTLANHSTIDADDGSQAIGRSSTEPPAARNKVRTRDIVQIFVDENRRDFIQVTPEQVDRVRAMHQKMADGTRFTFNYNTLLLVASLLAGLGLISNSSTTIIASMLVSPIMG